MWKTLTDKSHLEKGVRIKLYDEEYVIEAIKGQKLTLVKIQDSAVWDQDKESLIDSGAQIFE